MFFTAMFLHEKSKTAYILPTAKKKKSKE